MPSLEETCVALISTLRDHTLALNANTEAHGGKPAAAGKPGTKPGTTPAKLTGEMVKAIVLKVRDEFDKTAALALIKKHAKANEIAGIKPTFYQAVYDACEEKLASKEVEGDEAPAEDDDSL